MQVSFEKIDQSYGGQNLFRQLDLLIPSGQFFTLLGPSGCGKTTLLRMLAGFVQPDRGCVRFGSQDVTAVPAYQRGVGIVFQDYALFPDRSVLANVAYGLLARGVSKAEAAQRAGAMLKRVGLEAFKDRSPAALSGGQRQRVAMARALVIEPKLLLLDEPLSALDVKLRVELRSMIRELQQEAGITTVFVTHDQEEALAMSDQIAVMDRGQVIQIGTPQAIYTTPRTAFAADFVGNANLIPILEELPADHCGTRRLKTPLGTLFTNSAAPCPAGALLAVRGGEVTLHSTAGAGEGYVPGQVEHVEYRGSTVGYTLKTAIGMFQVEAWEAQHEPLRKRGEVVAMHIPRTAHIVEGRSC